MANNLRAESSRLSSKESNNKEEDSPRTYLGRLSVGLLVLAVIVGMFTLYYYIGLQKEAPESSGTTDASTPTQTNTSKPVIPSTGVVSCEDLGCPAGSQFIGSSQSNVYHECDSSYALAILPGNRICFYNSTEAEAQGYREAAK